MQYLNCAGKKEKSKMSTSVFEKSKVLKSKGISTATETEVCQKCLIILGVCVAVLIFLSGLKTSLLFSLFLQKRFV